MSREPSRADREFEQRLRSAGIELPAARVQRFREVGLLPAPDRQFSGGGGSDGRYPDKSVEQAREAIELVDLHPRALWRAVIDMFARGNFAVDEHKLKRHLLHAIDRFEQEIYRAAQHEGEQFEDRTEIALAAGSVLAKRLARDPEAEEIRRRVKRRPREARTSVMASVISNLSSIILSGEILAEEGRPEIFQALGLAPLTTDPYLDGKPVVSQDDITRFSELDGLAQIDHVRRVIAETSGDALERARDDWKDFVRFARVQSEILPRTTGSKSAYGLSNLPTQRGVDAASGAVVVLMLSGLAPLATSQQIDEMRRVIPRLRAISRHLDFLPKRFHRIYGPDGPRYAEQVTDLDKAELREAWDKFEKRHPIDAQLLSKLGDEDATTN